MRIPKAIDMEMAVWLCTFFSIGFFIPVYTPFRITQKVWMTSFAMRIFEINGRQLQMV